MMPSSRQSRQTFCRICEAACGLLADVDASGRLVHLRPDRQHPISQGFVCAKGTRFAEVAAHAERLLFPLRRQDSGAYERITWTAAMAFLAQRLRPLIERYGPQAVGIYFGNPLAFNTLGLLTILGFIRALGTRQVFSASSQDCHNKFAGAQLVHGSPFIHPLPDFAHTDVAILFGTNPAVSQASFIHLAGGSTVFDRLVQRRGKVIWIDPRYTESAQRWGEHIAIRPGTDIFLLLALLHALRQQYRPDPRVEGLHSLLDLAASYPVGRAAELTGIPAGRLHSLAETIRTARHVTLHMSVGVNQGPFGTLCYIALQALVYLAGHFDRQGGLLFHPLAVQVARFAQRWGVGTQPGSSRVGQFPSILDSLPAGILAEEILTPGAAQLRALLVIAGDPLTSIPGEPTLRRALRQLECLVSVDLFQNTTGREADLLLPATSWIERWDMANSTVLFQQAPVVQYAGPVCPAPGEARSEAHILADISLALDCPLWGSRAGAYMWRYLTRDACLAACARMLLWPARLLCHGVQGVPVPRPQAGRYLGYGPRTPGHRVRFWHTALSAEPDRLAAYAARRNSAHVHSRSVAQDHIRTAPPSQHGTTFALLCRRRRLGHNSWLHGAGHDGDPDGVAWMAPTDLVALGVPEGAELLFQTASASLRLPTVPDSGVLPGTVVVPHGVPGMNVNALIPTGVAMLEPLSGQHYMTGTIVQVSLATQSVAAD
jgi:formate dehydrogenase